MLMIVSRSSLLDDLLDLLGDLGVSGTTQLPQVYGVGETGAALGTFASPASNSVILAALDDRDADRIGAELRAFSERRAVQQRGEPLPLRVFFLPCTQVV